MVALNGVPDLSISTTGLQVEIEHGLVPSNLPMGVPTTIGGVDLKTLGSTDITQVQGMAAINVASFVSLSGMFSFTESVSNDSDMMGTTTKILVGASDVNASVGVEDGSGNLV